MNQTIIEVDNYTFYTDSNIVRIAIVRMHDYASKDIRFSNRYSEVRDLCEKILKGMNFIEKYDGVNNKFSRKASKFSTNLLTALTNASNLSDYIKNLDNIFKCVIGSYELKLINMHTSSTWMYDKFMRNLLPHRVINTHGVEITL